MKTVSKVKACCAALVLLVLVVGLGAPLVAAPGGACKDCEYGYGGLAYCVAANENWGYEECWIQTVLGEEWCVASSICIIDNQN